MTRTKPPTCRKSLTEIGRDKSYFVKSHTKSNNKYKQNNIIQMLDGLISNICVLFGGLVLQQTIGIPMGINCAPFKGFSRIKIEN